MGARRYQFIDPLWVGLDKSYSPSPTSHNGEVACFVWHSYPAVVRGFAPPTGGYEASDRKRSFSLMALIAPIPSDQL